MSNPSKRKGTQWESSIVACLQENGWPHVERRALAGNLDRGDIAGIPGIVIEAKNAKTIALGPWLDEAQREMVNDHAELGAVWFKRRGRVHAAEGFVLLDGATFMWLLKHAGYGGTA